MQKSTPSATEDTFALNQRARFRSRGLGPRPVSGGVYSLQAQSKPSARIGAEGVCIRCKRKANHRLESVLRVCIRCKRKANHRLESVLRVCIRCKRKANHF